MLGCILELPPCASSASLINVWGPHICLALFVSLSDHSRAAPCISTSISRSIFILFVSAPLLLKLLNSARLLTALYAMREQALRFILEQPSGDVAKGVRRKRARLVTACDSWCATSVLTVNSSAHAYL